MSEKKFRSGVAETDGDFFESLHEMERRIFTEMGDTEALAILDKERAETEADDEDDD